MIGTEQERDAIMAAIEEYGQARADTESAGERVSYEAAIAEQKIAEQHLAAIRAMLAPDDAVKVPTDLFERTREKLSQLAYFLDCGDDPIFVEAFGILDELAVLRGEATR